MNEPLPPLPEPRLIRAGHSFPKVYALAYTADQMKEYALYALSQQPTLEPAPEPSMSMYASKEDYYTARSAWAVRRPAGEDRADALRYRWLRGERAFRNPEYSTPTTAFWGFYSSPMLVGPSLDAAIDAAMKERPCA